MKKILLIAAVASMTMVSCKKDYTCECITEEGESGSTVKTTTTSVINAKKADAEIICNAGDYNFNFGTEIDKSECSIK
ncbi:hypothetical protein [Aurantibacillus circumpalustris]|uniref:hypothetical protein n=1 Tax=Aurantibacillus circumpalustris TaxID=3036359 RepID=UPI00295AB206|nr:hypothetical protein [Aurantibacillus circumpalustris]